MTEVCYASGARMYRQAMAGSVDATELPPPSSTTGAEQWNNAATVLGEIGGRIEKAIGKAEAAHRGKAAEAAQASVREMVPHIEACKATAEGVRDAINQQAGYQHEAFRALPAKGETLPDGRPAQIDPPEKGWVEDYGIDNVPLLGDAMSDYEERQERFQATNEHAEQVMRQYQGKTDTLVGQLPEFRQPAPAQQPPPSPSGGDSGTGSSGLSSANYSSTPTMGGGSAAAGSSSVWSSGGGVAAGGSYSPSGGSVP
ncbi:hypothetical protein DFQ14_112162, partial [Halopolyspora algeriensis]